MLERTFQGKVIKELKDTFEGCLILKNDPNYLQGVPDLLILYKKRWAALEIKKDSKAKKQPNQEFYVNHMNKMSYSAFICPENKFEIFKELMDVFKGGKDEV